MRRRSFVAMLMLGVAAACASEGGVNRGASVSAPNNGTAFPDPTPPMPTSKRSVTVRLFAVTGCPVAQSYGAEWKRLIADYAARGVSFELVVSEPKIDAPRADAWARTYGFPSEPRLDPELIEAARVEATHSPQAIVSDSSGNVVYRGRIDDRWTALRRQRAAPNERSLEAAIKAALAGETPPKASTPVVGCLLERR